MMGSLHQDLLGAAHRQARRLAQAPWLRRPRQALQELEQVRAYEGLVRRIAQAPPYDERATRDRLQALAPHRRPWPAPERRARVLIFGYENWEAHGFWDAFGKVAEVSFVSLGDLKSRCGIRGHSRAEAERLARACLAEVEAHDAGDRLSLVFVYSYVDNLLPELFIDLRRRRLWTAIMGLDDWCRFHERDEYGRPAGQEAILPYVDLLWSSWRGAAILAQAQGSAGWYAGEGVDPAVHRPLDLSRDIDVLFLGTRYSGRAELVDAVRRAGIPVQAFGTGWPAAFVSFEESVRLINRAHVVLGYGGKGLMRAVHGLKGRDFEVPACGAAYLTSYNAELAEHFRIGEEILAFSSPSECVELLHDVLPRPERLEALRLAGRARVLRDHTWEGRVRRLLSLFEPR
jgi:hypothetical protein